MIEIKEKKNQLLECLNIISELVIEVNITFTSEYMYINAIHPSNHCMTTIKIFPSLFEKYEIENDITYTLDIQQLLKIIKNLSSSTLKIFPEENVLVFKDAKHTYKLNYFVSSKNEKPISKFEHKNKINIKSSEFFDTISKSVVFDQIGKFELEDNEFFITTKSHLVKGRTKLNTISIEGENDKVYYDLSYVDMVKNLKKLFKEINLFLDSEFPLLIKCNNADIDVNFILANRVEA